MRIPSQSQNATAFRERENANADAMRGIDIEYRPKLIHSSVRASERFAPCAAQTNAWSRDQDRKKEIP